MNNLLILRASLRYWLVALLMMTGIPAVAKQGFDAGLAPFEVQVNSEQLQHNIVFRTLLEDEVLKIHIVTAQDSHYSVRQGDEMLELKQGAVQWTAPKAPGLYPVSITRLSDQAKIQLQVFVMHAASKLVKGRLNDYRIGKYPPPLKNLANNRAPRGYIELTPELEQVAISPHFRLGQFKCKQAGGYPKYLVLRPRLLEKLEFLLHQVNKKGINTNSFVIMSGYRTPYYNKAIGNVPHSRHIYGGAADIYIDVDPVDNVMDDINRDGKVNVKDAAYLYNLADRFVRDTGRKHLVGGVGEYTKNASHGPFVHIDVRGSRARWGHK